MRTDNDDEIDRLTRELEIANQQVQGLYESCKVLELAQAEAMALVLSHEAVIERLTAASAETKSLLRGIEWNGNVEDQGFCPVCCVVKEFGTHDDDCLMAKALSSDAGEGWVSPERAQKLRDAAHHLGELVHQEYINSPGSYPMFADAIIELGKALEE